MGIVLSFGGPKEGAVGNEPSSHTLLFPQLVLPQNNFIYFATGHYRTQSIGGGLVENLEYIKK